MNRRAFLRLMGIGAVTAPAVIKAVEKSPEPKGETISDGMGGTITFYDMPRACVPFYGISNGSAGSNEPVAFTFKDPIPTDYSLRVEARKWLLSKTWPRHR